MLNRDFFIKTLFSLIVLTLPLQKFFNISFIPFGNGISVYFSIIVLLIYIFTHQSIEYTFEKLAFKYFIIYLFLLGISFVIGMLSFDRIDLLYYSYIDKLQKLPRCILNSDMFTKNFAQIVAVCKALIKDGLILGVLTFGTSFWIVLFFKNRWKDAFIILRKCSFIIFIICIVYSFVEFFYLKGYALPTYMLMQINPFLYHIDFTSSITWPPLLWGDRMRSIFLEPSYCAIFLSSILPIFLTYFNNINIQKLKYTYYTIFTLIIFVIFATNSKTAMILMLFLCGFIIFMGISWRKKFLKTTCLLISCVLISCIGYFLLLRSSYIIPSENPSVQDNIVKDIYKKMNIQDNNIPRQQYQIINILDSYLEKNVENLNNVNYGSNSSRYGVAFAELGIFMDHPVWGTGSAELLQPYIYEYLPAFSNNSEVRRWTKFNWKHGVMSHKMPVLNDFTNKLAKFGLVGFSVFYFPLLYFLFKIFKNWKKMSFIDKQYICALLAGLCCIFIGCMAGPLNLFFTYWVFLGVLGAIALTDYDKNKNVE